MGPATTKLFRRSEIERLRDARRVSAEERGRVIAVGDVFEVVGPFDPDVVGAFGELNELVEDSRTRGEMVRAELRLIEDLCTSTELSLPNEVLARAARYLIEKIKDTEAS